MKVKFITAIYSDLHGTELGGRPSRGGHYKYSLLSLLKMSEADFLCYTSDREIEDLKDFFYKQHNIDESKLQIKVSDLKETKFKELINQYKNLEWVTKGDRCHEIQFNKFHWWWDEDKSYDYYYWIDAGLSHSGLIPEKYLVNNHPYARYFESTLFNNEFLKNLVEDTGEKFLILGKENQRNYWSGTVQQKWYTNYDSSIHVIGGLFGGRKEKWDEIVNLFEHYLKTIFETDKQLYHEENLMSLMYFNHKDLFTMKQFDIWWYRGNKIPGVSDETFDHNKSFFKILTELNRINDTL